MKVSSTSVGVLSGKVGGWQVSTKCTVLLHLLTSLMHLM
jgi:hypothetical protein